MLSWWNNFLGDRRGVSAIEFAILAPVLLIVVGGVVEVGRLLAEGNQLEKSVQAGAMVAARRTLPLDAASLTDIQNAVRTGRIDGTAPLLLPGWTDGGSSLTITVTPQSVLGQAINVIRIDAIVPHVPIVQGLMDLAGLGALPVAASRE